MRFNDFARVEVGARFVFPRFRKEPGMSTRAMEYAAKDDEAFYKDALWTLEEGLLAGELLKQGSAIVHQGTKVSVALRLTDDLDAAHLAVTDEQGKPVGVVSLSDLAGRPPETEVWAWMGGSPITVDFDAPVSEAATIMRERMLGCVPVLEQGRVVGLLTRGDLEQEGFLTKNECPRCALCHGYHHIRPDDVSGLLLCPKCTEAERLREEIERIGDDIWSTD
jgi:CBS domain-containing protein